MLKEHHVPDDKVQVLATRSLLDDFLRVQETILRYRKYNGKLSGQVRRLSLERGNSAAVILYDVSSQEVVLVEQFKWPTYAVDGGWVVETLAGVVDGGEDPADTAVREALEETGYALDSPTFICRYYSSPGGSSEQIYLYFAEIDDSMRVGPGGGLTEEGEDIRLRRYTIESAGQAVSEGEIIDAKAIIGLNWIRERLGAQ
jgi:nudix-type nucleoside diphosphatase (YffH/AdpP family)